MIINIREKTVQEKIKDVREKYQVKLDQCIASIPVVFAADGASQQSKLNTISTDYLSKIAARNAEIDALEEEL